MEGGVNMSALQEEAVQMISALSDDNVSYLIDFIKRFMQPTVIKKDFPNTESKQLNLMQEMENMREKDKGYFPESFDEKHIWEEAMKDKYGSSN